MFGKKSDTSSDTNNLKQMYEGLQKSGTYSGKKMLHSNTTTAKSLLIRHNRWKDR
jgi:hypothetical protein